MTGQDLLNRIKARGKDVDSAKAVYNALFLRLTSGTARLREAVVKGSSDADRFASLSSAGERLDALQQEYSDLVELAQSYIAELEDDRYRRDLRYRYIVGMTARRTAQEMHYGYSWEREIHRRAVEAFEAVWAKRKEP